jgi:hypothetical protein
MLMMHVLYCSLYDAIGNETKENMLIHGIQWYMFLMDRRSPPSWPVVLPIALYL